MLKRTTAILQALMPFSINRTSEIVKVNPTVAPERKEPDELKIDVFHYTEDKVEVKNYKHVTECFAHKTNGGISWINVDGLRKDDIEKLCVHFGVHPLIQEDILHENQRAKMDEIGDVVYCVCNMLYYNEKEGTVEQEQLSIVLGKGFVLSFQEDPKRDVFDPLREKLKINSSKIRRESADYLCYTMLDMIVDNYFLVMEKLGERIESVEEEIQRKADARAFIKLNIFKKELIVLQRSIKPVREMINGFLRSESDLLEDRNTKYFKDVYDHIVQANDLAENYRDMTMSIHDMYLSNVNMKMNEVMKVMAIVTCLLAPATVIGGIFGMNFERLPLLHDKNGFYIAAFAMLVVPMWMLWWFKKKGWF
jgi:magnesium transporter